ncbi:hypothetical protein IMSAGC008_02362 [Muribaculaceae bacterium]|nr:hypothetical protein IMSAGC008_02362 [Muribaculaceae bacterium]
MVAHYEAAELEVGAQESPRGIVPEAYGCVVVFEVGGDCACSDVAPFAYDGVAEEAVVGFVGVSLEYHVVQLAAYLAVRAYGCRTVYFGAHVDHRVLAHGYGAAQHGAFHHFGVRADVYGALGGVEECAFDGGSFADVYQRGVADDGVGGA